MAEKIVIFGLGVSGRALYRMLEDKNIVAFIENNKSLDGTSFKGTPVFHISKLDKLDFDKIALSVWINSMLNQLENEYHIPKVKFLQTFGTSETGISTTSSKSSDSLYMKIEDANQEYKIVDNELLLRSKTQVLGYLNASMDSFTSDGWFKTGDLVEELEDGYLKIIGRSKEVINVGGQKVLPAEVESVILSMDEVDDCMVYSEVNVITGQTVVCDVVLHEPKENIKKIIRLFCKDKLDAFKIPTKVNVVEKTNFSDRFKKIRIK